MRPAHNTLNTLAADTQGLDALKLKAKNNPGESVAAASKQFEALFLGMVLKGMRAASPQEGPFDNEQSRLYTSLLDQQLAQHMAKRGIGLAEVMTRQMSATFSDSIKPGNPLPEMPGVIAPPVGAPPVAPSATPPTLAPPAARAVAPVSSNAVSQQPGDFVNRVWSHAVDAAQAIGVQPQFIVGQAALESGWGKYEIRTADGQPSHNLFGIKAHGNWKGPSVEKSTIEYVNGVAIKTTDKFRVYASYNESFRDYANLLRDNARYAGVIGQTEAKGFAQGLQRGGYATDPAYADKLVSIINSTRDLVVPKGLPEPPVDVAVAQRGVPAQTERGRNVAWEHQPAVYATGSAYAGGLVRAAYRASEPIGAGAYSDAVTRTATPYVPPPASGAVAGVSISTMPANQPPVDFVNRVWSHAVVAAQELGVQPQFVVGHAALETGWGKHEIRTADGQPSYNLFGIKAGADWKGQSVEKTATAYVNGVAVKTTEKFRVYTSYSESFRDYANRLRDNTRYAGVIGQTEAKGFAQGLQRGGYATDPVYAGKLVSVINSPPIKQAAAAEHRPQVLALR